MPTTDQITVDVMPTEGGLGDVAGYSTVDSATMQYIFSKSPLYGDYDPQKFYEENVMNAEIKNGYGFASFKTTFEGAPNFDEVETGGQGKPASAWVPNPVSPGPGSQNPSDIGAPPADFGTVPNGDVYGNGQGAVTNPSKTSVNIAKTTLKDYKLPEGPGQRLYEAE